ncbi:MAG: phosphonatase-like hydrolase [Cyanobacteria bacterium]|nr:phosphonatase-like hydrolase [Cyanobacteriota bacterium]
MTHPALVVFDMAGTTIEDSGQVPTAFAATLAAHDITIRADEITRVRGASKRQAIRNLLPPRLREDASARQAFEAEADRIYAEFRKNLGDAYRNGGARAVPGADGVIRKLRGCGVKVALTTGFDRDIATLLLTTIGWTPRSIDAIVCGDDVSNGRPAPDMILLAMKLTGVEDALQVANVGDTTSDLESAARAGVRWNIGVLSGAHTREALERAPHTAIIDSVADLNF